jgi:hypothetical protein
MGMKRVARRGAELTHIFQKWNGASRRDRTGDLLITKLAFKVQAVQSSLLFA